MKAGTRPIDITTLVFKKQVVGLIAELSKRVAVADGLGFDPELKSKIDSWFSRGEGHKKVLMRPSGESPGLVVVGPFPLGS